MALLFLLPPLLRRRVTAPDTRVSANAAIYTEQLAELAADRERGALALAEFERASREVERRIVAEHSESEAAPAQHRAQPAAALVVGLLVPLMAVLAYWQLGTPEALGGAAKEPAHSVSGDQMDSMVERLAARLQQTPEDAAGWMLLGRSLAVLGQHERAAKAYARAVQLLPKDAELLADYADVLAMARGGKLQGEPSAIVMRALAIDPENIKALALAGSAGFERGAYNAAIRYWERALKLAAPDTEFSRSVADSLAEARTLAGGPAVTANLASSKRTPAQKGGEALQGVVSIEPAFAARLSPGDAVFVLARPVSGSRMPLAVARTTVGALPYRFKLDDSMAMAPGATISSHEKVVVAARVSRSGTALPQKGDIEGTSAPVAPGTSGLTVVMSRVID